MLWVPQESRKYIGAEPFTHFRILISFLLTKGPDNYIINLTKRLS
jgi:hypothetical protein